MTTSCDITVQEIVSNSLTLSDAWVIGLFSAVIIGAGTFWVVKRVERWAE